MLFQGCSTALKNSNNKEFSNFFLNIKSVNYFIVFVALSCNDHVKNNISIMKVLANKTVDWWLFSLTELYYRTDRDSSAKINS